MEQGGRGGTPCGRLSTHDSARLHIHEHDLYCQQREGYEPSKILGLEEGESEAELASIARSLHGTPLQRPGPTPLPATFRLSNNPQDH